MGQVLQANRGSWRRDRDAVFTYQWSTCEASSTSCAEIIGATDSIYPVRPGDAGRRLLVSVTATTSSGATVARSASTPMVHAAPEGSPLVMERPTLDGKVQSGSTLTAGDGTWKGTEPIRLTYRWRRCAAEGGPCSDLAKTGQTYTLTARDVGRTLRVLVRAANSIATSAALSDPTPVVPGATPPTVPPRNTSPPLISGVAMLGRTLTTSGGTWSGTTPMSFAFQWRRCAKDGEECSPIPGADRPTYTATTRDVGRSLRAGITARNSAGASTVVSDRSRVVIGASAPVNTVPPAISGSARDGEVLTVSSGAWRGSPPITFEYQWLDCGPTGGGCARLDRATKKSLALTSRLIGRTVRARIAASNGAGSALVLSGPSPVIAGKGTAPANTAPPFVSGSPLQGSRLSLSTGSWSGTQPLSFSFQWRRCDANASHCGTIGGATGSTYVLTRAEVGHRLFGVVTARNRAGSGTASSNVTPVVVGAPVNASPPKIAGTPREGESLTASPGTWVGAGAISYGYQWTRCDAQGVFSSCVPIIVTTRPVYTLRAADVGHRVFVQVGARNGYGTSFGNSAMSEVITAATVGTVTVHATRSIVPYGSRVVVSGRAVGARPGDPVTIYEQPLGHAMRVRATVTVVGATGSWTFVARPTIRTTYQARVRGRTSGVVTVRVRPRLHLRHVGSGRVVLRIVAARSLAGRTAFLQRWNAHRRRWVAVRRLNLRPVRAGTPGLAITGVRFRPGVPRGVLVRVVLPSRQAAPGYLTGISNRIRS